MRQTHSSMGMPVTIEIVDDRPDTLQATAQIFTYFKEIDARFSTYKTTSEISKVNAGLPRERWSSDMKLVMGLCEQTKRETHGYFDVLRPDGTLDPSGLVKGWAINNAAHVLRAKGFTNFYVDAGGDIQPNGHNVQESSWRFGIRNPFEYSQIVKTVRLTDEGIATSGTAIRGQHIYNPNSPSVTLQDIVSLTVIGPDVYEADRFATAAFAMGREGIAFIESRVGLEGYMIDSKGIATMTSGFERFTA